MGDEDKAWVGGHFYSVKAPGLAALTLPAYLALDAAGAKTVARDAAANARLADRPRWDPPEQPNLSQYAYSAARAHRVEIRIEHETPIVWALTLVGAVIPAIALLLLVRWVTERIERATAPPAAITLGLGTIVFTFASEYFSHVIAATLGFAAFALLFREREGRRGPGWSGPRSFLAGLAICFEYPLGLVAAILFAYALARPPPPAAPPPTPPAPRSGPPRLAFNWCWTLGSPLPLRLLARGRRPGTHRARRSGPQLERLLRDRPAATRRGARPAGGQPRPPHPDARARHGGGRGSVSLRKRGRAAEAAVIGAVGITYFLYNTGYWLPFGGGSPGPRFLIPALPFLAIGLGSAYRRLPAVTLALAIPSVIFMIAGTLTYPLIGDNGTGIWANQLGDGTLEHTLLTVLGVQNGWLAVAPCSPRCGPLA